ncbi:MAG: aquaporin [Bacilli bacterium]|jgi:aquaporin Z|nr:aquaporin [Bacilli bacterium]MCH4277797.1 aquaporin [Bacilli bacterium]MCI2054967.1 aquaporin [Bacilli bacterium]
MELFKKAVAECIGTMVLVIVGCGVAVVTNANVVATALAFGLSIVAMAYSIGNVSGCHINPAVSPGFALTKKMSWKDFFVYVAAQFVGAIIGALILELVFINIDSGNALGANSCSTLLPNDGGTTTVAGLMLGLLVEVVLTFIFVLAILGVCSKKEFSNVAGIVIGLTLTLVHLLGIPLTGTSVNPARSFGPALIAMMNGVYEPIKEIWIFIVGPLAGAALAALLFNFLSSKKEIKEEATLTSSK